MVRLAHFSDIHLSAPRYGWKLEDWFNKRVTSWFHLRALGRARRFRRAEEIVSRMMDELPERGIDHLVFSGDATTLGFETEIRRAAELLRVDSLPIKGLAIPGNHDYCTPKAAASGDFEHYFAAWQDGRRIGEYTYPFAQQVGPVWLVGVNAATGNRLPWDATGAVDLAQLQRLRQLLGELDGSKILVVHFPICLANGQPETRDHGLRNLDAVVDVAHAGGAKLWLHGHRHMPYFHERPNGAAFPAICAGAVTQRGIWSYGEYTIDGVELAALRRVYDPAVGAFADAQRFTLRLE